MSTLQKRAEKYAQSKVIADNNIVCDILKEDIENRYISGANAQRKIDIERACSYLEDNHGFTQLKLQAFIDFMKFDLSE